MDDPDFDGVIDIDELGHKSNGVNGTNGRIHVIHADSIPKWGSITMSSRSMGYRTPEGVLERVRAVSRTGQIEFDPCTDGENPTQALRYYAPPQDGLKLSWHTEVVGGGIVYLNPPYGKEIAKWMRRAALEAVTAQLEIIALVPARTDTEWFSTSVWNRAAATCFVRGRLIFKLPGQTKADAAPFPSVLAYYGRRPVEFRKRFCDLGKCIEFR